MRISDWSSDVCSSDLASANEHFGQRYERRREIDECLHTQQIRDHWLPVIISSDTREEKLRQSQAAIQDQHQPERLPNLLNVQDRRLHECAAKPIAVHASHEIDDHQRHGESAIIGRTKETTDNERTRPGRSEEHTSEIQNTM